MPLSFKMGLFLALCGALWLFIRWRSPRPEFPPLQTDPDDPLLLAAMERATATRDAFRAHLAGSYESALIKLRFVSSSSQVEHLWAEVVEVLGHDELGVRLVTPPVTHSGPLDRLHRCTYDDIEDWQVRGTDGRIHGGFTQRAMFAIARRDGIPLPKQLAQHEAEYVDS
jgi:uncharacterized protein YegJ (DUF2314 family)